MDMDLDKLFPRHLSNDFKTLQGVLPLAKHPPNIRSRYAFIGTEKITVECRIYNEWPASVVDLPDMGSRMLHALYTKHHDGRTRQRCLESILNYDDEWIPPFVFWLLGEYVIEIVNVINERKESLAHKKSYQVFVKSNPDYLNFIENRCASYWDCYYRHKYKAKKEYPGIVCLNYLRDIKLPPMLQSCDIL